MTKKLRPLAALAMVALIGAGCSNTTVENGNTDTDTGTGAATASGGNKNATAREKGVKFAECMRNSGVPDFPDPDASGQFQYGVSVTVEEWRKAVRACKELQPPGTLSGKRTPKQQSASLKFANCIRANGVKDFPDPVNGEPLVDTYKIPSANRPGGMNILNAAMEKCGDILEDAAGRNP